MWQKKEDWLFYLLKGRLAKWKCSFFYHHQTLRKSQRGPWRDSKRKIKLDSAVYRIWGFVKPCFRPGIRTPSGHFLEETCFARIKLNVSKPLQTRAPIYDLFLYSYHPMCESDILLGSLCSRKNNTAHMTASMIFTYPIACQTANSTLCWINSFVFPTDIFRSSCVLHMSCSRQPFLMFSAICVHTYSVIFFSTLFLRWNPSAL